MKILLALFICFCLFACQRVKETDEIKVTVLRGPSAIAFARWMEESPVIAGKKVQLRIADSPEQVLAQMIKEEADITVLPMINAANLYNKKVPYLLAGCPVWGNLYLVGQADAKLMHIFGAGTTPDILTRYYMDKHQLSYTLNYTLGTASEVVRGLLGGKVEASVLAEPFVTMVTRQVPNLGILADLNNPSDSSPGFAETAVMIHKNLIKEKEVINRLLEATCRYANEQPEKVIAILEQQEIFPAGMLTKEAIERCRIMYLPANESKDEIASFLEIIYQYEPKALGNRLPDEAFYN